MKEQIANPFDVIHQKLSHIEILILEIQESSVKEKEPINIDVEQAALKLNLSKQTIWKNIKNGTIPAKKIGRKYIINSAELNSVLQEVKSLKYRR